MSASTAFSAMPSSNFLERDYFVDTVGKNETNDRKLHEESVGTGLCIRPDFT